MMMRYDYPTCRHHKCHVFINLLRRTNKIDHPPSKKYRDSESPHNRPLVARPGIVFPVSSQQQSSERAKTKRSKQGGGCPGKGGGPLFLTPPLLTSQTKGPEDNGTTMHGSYNINRSNKCDTK